MIEKKVPPSHSAKASYPLMALRKIQLSTMQNGKPEKKSSHCRRFGSEKLMFSPILYYPIYAEECQYLTEIQTRRT